MQAEKAFPSGNVLVAYEFMVTQIPQNINNKELLILFISTSNVVFTSNTFLHNFFHIHLCKTDTVMI